MIKFSEQSVAVRHFLSLFLSAVAVLGVVLAFGRPAAEEIMDDRIEAKGYGGRLKNLELNYTKIETNQKTLIYEVREGRKAQTEMWKLLQKMNGRDQ